MYTVKDNSFATERMPQDRDYAFTYICYNKQAYPSIFL
jgi:hypothetical protein